MNRSAKSNRSGRIARLIAGLLLLFVWKLPARAAEGILDYNRFMRDIEPIITTTTYASPVAGATCLSCHGDPTNIAFSTFPIVLGEHRNNFLNVARHVEIDTPDLSPILLVPMTPNFGGLGHGTTTQFGGSQFTGPNDANYLTILNWIIDARRATIGARISKTLPYPNPFRFDVNIVYFLTTTALDVTVTIYRQDGSTVLTYPGTTNVGANRVTWDGRDANLEPMSTGIYFYAVKARFNDGTNTAKGTIVYTP